MSITRRTILKHMMMATAAAAVLPACTFESKKASLALGHLTIDADLEEFLSQIVETIIPATDIPGAKGLGVHLFVLKMIDDCYEKKVQEDFVMGVNRIREIATEKFGKSFGQCAETEREEVLGGLENKINPFPSAITDTFRLIKRLTILGFLTSQYVMMDVQKFEFIPGRFNGCVPVPKLSS